MRAPANPPLPATSERACARRLPPTFSEAIWTLAGSATTTVPVSLSRARSRRAAVAPAASEGALCEDRDAHDPLLRTGRVDRGVDRGALRGRDLGGRIVVLRGRAQARGDLSERGTGSLGGGRQREHGGSDECHGAKATRHGWKATPCCGRFLPERRRGAGESRDQDLRLSRSYFMMRPVHEDAPGASSGAALGTTRREEQGAHGKSHRYRSRNDQQLYGRPRGRRADRHPQRRGWTHHAVRRRLHQGRPAGRRHAGQAPGGHEPAEHRLLDQAVHGTQALGGLRGDEDRPVRGRGRAERRRARRRVRQAVLAAGDLGDDPAEAEGGRRGVSRRVRHRRGHHRAGVLQRRTAPGHQGRRQDRRPERPAHRQRAHRGIARVRARQGAGADDPRLRPRRRHVRRVGARARRRRQRGQGDRR